jgi:Notch-like protein
MFAVFNQTSKNRGYLVFYGTSGSARNFGVYLENNSSKIWFYYTTTLGEYKNFTIDANWDDNQIHSIVVTVDTTSLLKLVNFYLDGVFIGVKTLTNPDFTYGVTSSNTASLFIGARLPRYFRFVGTIYQVVFFQEIVSQSFALQLHQQFFSLVTPSGICTLYLQVGAACPPPTTANSTLCQSPMNRCDPTTSCIPDMDLHYTCQPQPLECTSDEACMPDYFCSNITIPSDHSNYFQNPASAFPGESIFLQENPMIFTGENFVSLPASKHPNLLSDLTIFAVVRQEPGNDGYVVGKGLDDKMRDFGLYLRSTRNTVWFAYGSDDNGKGFREIMFFYNIRIADGNFHSVAAVIDSSSNRAILYVDGVVAGQQSPLPAVPAFRPGFNILYVGGRPRTQRFQFRGVIRNLFVGTAPFQPDAIEQLHKQSIAEGSSFSLTTPVTRYCSRYINTGGRCIVGSVDFKCLPTDVCVPICSYTSSTVLPLQSSTYKIYGICTTPCDCDDAISYECGTDGITYHNSCQRMCAGVLKLHDGRCVSYNLIYNNTLNN